MRQTDPLLARADAAIADSVQLRAEIRNELSIAIARMTEIRACMERTLALVPGREQVASRLPPRVLAAPPRLYG